MENKKKTIVALALITAVCLAGDSMLYIVLPIHWREAGLSSLIEVGILLSINRFVRLPLNPIIGLMYKKISFRTGILIAVILAGITTFCYGVVDQFSLWVILRSIWGLAWSLFKLGAFLLILQLSTDSNRGIFMGTYNGLYRLGSLVGMLLGGLLADVFGLKIISIVLGLIVFTTIPFILIYLPKSLETVGIVKKEQKFLDSVKHFKNSSLLWMLLTAFLTVMILEGMFNATLSHLIDVKLNKEIDIFTFMVGAATTAGILQAIRWGLLPFISPIIGSTLDKVQYKQYILAIFLVFASILLLLIPQNMSLTIWLPLVLLHLLIASCVTTIVDTLFAGLASTTKDKVMIMTSYTIIVDLGAALGPLLGYSLEEVIGLANLFMICSFICFVLSLKWGVPSKLIKKYQLKKVTGNYNNHV